MPDVIGQAEAVIRRRFGIDSAAAYELLVKLSWPRNGRLKRSPAS
jgi:hypothetical protein